jgi:hypothetical protein
MDLVGFSGYGGVLQMRKKCEELKCVDVAGGFVVVE